LNDAGAAEPRPTPPRLVFDRGQARRRQAQRKEHEPDGTWYGRQVHDEQDVVSSVFGLSNTYGAILVTASTPDLAVYGQVLAQTAAGHVGQGLPAVSNGGYVRPGVARLLGATGALTGGRIVVSTPTTDGAFAAMASIIEADSGYAWTVMPR